MMSRVMFSCRSPWRFRRCLTVFPEDAGSGKRRQGLRRPPRSVSEGTGYPAHRRPQRPQRAGAHHRPRHRCPQGPHRDPGHGDRRLGRGRLRPGRPVDRPAGSPAGQQHAKGGPEPAGARYREMVHVAGAAPAGQLPPRQSDRICRHRHGPAGAAALPPPRGYRTFSGRGSARHRRRRSPRRQRAHSRSCSASSRQWPG